MPVIAHHLHFKARSKKKFLYPRSHLPGYDGLIVLPDMPDVSWKGAVFLIGLTGGIGAGKSTAAKCFAQAGAIVANADEMAHAVLEQEQTIHQLRDEFGDDILAPDGRVSREALAQIVFKDEDRLAKLNAIMHPSVGRMMEARVEALEPGSIFVYDVPLLFEAARASRFDLTITVTASLAVRLARVEKRSGWSRQELQSREANQLPLSEKEKRADLVIRNESDLESLCADIASLVNHIRSARQE